MESPDTSTLEELVPVDIEPDIDDTDVISVDSQEQHVEHGEEEDQEGGGEEEEEPVRLKVTLISLSPASTPSALRTISEKPDSSMRFKLLVDNETEGRS